MGKFITGEELEKAVYDIIWDAEQTLLLVSPFIKLDDYFKDLFKRHENNPNIHLIVVFGKNEKEVKKSLSKEDIEYFKKFLNVSIIYVPNLHAKYYGNERKGVISSINLYDYSFKNNIEFGVYSEQSIFDRFSKSADNDAWDVCIKIAEESEVVFIKRPVFEKKKLIINLGKNYIKSDVLHDSTEKFYGFFRKNNSLGTEKRLNDFPEELELGSVDKQRPERIKEEELPKFGYCIRTGSQIPFNPKQPMSLEAYRSWSEYKNYSYPEKYCHKTGTLSNGKTNLRNLILNL